MPSTFDAAMLLLRLGLGAMLLVHGANKVLGAGGIQGTERWFLSLGLRPAWLHARLAAGTEAGCGVLLMLGLLTPFACAGYIGLMLVAGLIDHRGKGFFVFKGGWEYVAVVGLVAAYIATVGAGDWSLDAAVGWRPFGPGWGLLAIGLGILSAAVLVVAGRDRSTVRDE